MRYLWANGTVQLLKSDWLTYKVNRNMSWISVIRLQGRIGGAALVTFISLVWFRNYHNSWIQKYWIYYIEHSRRAAKCTPHVLQACAEACARAIAHLSVISLSVCVLFVGVDLNHWCKCQTTKTGHKERWNFRESTWYLSREKKKN